ncbi:MAG: undecaprenyl-diphosphate phosphatase [Methylococcales bacterium]|nr:undecaprenyl-diphosphate phosphatase [Methylococcales bacterium]
MDWLPALLLALLQGLTEFLPISSSAHLILLPVITGWEDQGLAFDVAVHIGTLAAVLVYYRQDVYVMLMAWLRSLAGRGGSEDSRLAWYVILGTVPVGLVGLAINGAMATALRSPLVIAGATLVFAGVMAWAQRRGRQNRQQLTLRDMLWISLAQAVALIPGTSRSGITISVGLLLGLNAELSARFSFLLSIPVIALAGLLKGYELWQTPETYVWPVLLTSVVVSGWVAYLTIGAFIWLLNRVGMMPFVLYRVLLGMFLLAVFAF